MLNDLPGTDALIAFLEEQLAADERRALAAAPDWDSEDERLEWEDLPETHFAHARNLEPARILREVAAKREFLNQAKRAIHDADTLEKVGSQSVDVFTIRAPAEFTLALLAAPYSDRRGFRSEWLS